MTHPNREELAETCLRLADDRRHSIPPAVRGVLRLAHDELRQPVPGVTVEEVAGLIYDDLQGPVANPDFSRQMRRWQQCERIAQAIMDRLDRGEG